MVEEDSQIIMNLITLKRNIYKFEKKYIKKRN